MSIKDLQLEQQPIEVQHLIARMKQIEENLITETPGLPEALAEVHKHLQSHEELIHLMDENDIAILHKGFEKFKQIVVFQAAVKSVGKKKKLSENQLSNI